MKNKSLPILLFILVLLSSCRDQKQDSVAMVNGTPILLKDFQKEVALAKQRDPSLKMTPESARDLLEIMIERKVMVHEAVKEGLSDDERFSETIKRFWEQTLIRHLIDAKAKKWADKLYVSDDEVKRHYERMGYRVTFRFVNRPDEKAAAQVMEKLRRGETVEGAEVIGPLMIENMQWPSPLLSSFDQAQGEVRVSKEERGYSVIHVIKKEKVAAPVFEKVSGRIKETLFEQKKQHAFNEWMRALTKSAKVSIDTDMLKRIQDERK